jgi:iron only hydrogenase large subunit-like protein
MLGFKDVVEVALGADIIIGHEAEEFAHSLQMGKDFMTSSCCPAFVQYINLKYPELKDNVSTTVSPMIATARLVKSIDENAKVVFIGPCIAKKDEAHSFEDEVDFVLTFEELTGMILGKGIDIDELPSTPLNNASYFGRNFAGVGGVSKAFNDAIKEKDLDIEYETMVCDGIEECDKALKLAKAGRLKNIFIEGMYCKGGCIKGPVTMHYGAQDKKALNKYCQLAKEKEIEQAIRVFNLENIALEK